MPLVLVCFAAWPLQGDAINRAVSLKDRPKVRDLAIQWYTAHIELMSRLSRWGRRLRRMLRLADSAKTDVFAITATEIGHFVEAIEQGFRHHCRSCLLEGDVSTPLVATSPPQGQFFDFSELLQELFHLVLFTLSWDVVPNQLMQGLVVELIIIIIRVGIRGRQCEALLILGRDFMILEVFAGFLVGPHRRASFPRGCQSHLDRIFRLFAELVEPIQHLNGDFG
mmetsp:Transcript_70298/g.147189  ORF Transcript_70298/g.147189 Transcript_70298/m.147189 type:complete len:224 (-) Transcript_70298:327-998(-)